MTTRATARADLPAPLTYTVAEAAALVGISESSYYALLLKGEVPGRKVGNRWVVPKLHIERFLLGDELHVNGNGTTA